MTACDTCLRRGALVGFLSPYIARLVRTRDRVPGLLSLSEES